MIAAFVLLALITTLCVAVIGAAIEAILVQARRPLRWAWASALVLSLGLLASAPWRRDVAPRLVDSGVSAGAPSIPVIVTLSSAANRLPPLTPNVLLVTWAIASGAMLLLLLLVHLRYARLRRNWPTAQISGATVRVAPNDGPGVMGLIRPEIVVPRWLLDRAADDQTIVIAHEREHLRAGDPLLLGAAWVVAALVPWSPAVWWMLNRLRLAMELDCDARVLGGGAVPHVYGNVLIDVAALRSGIRLPAGALLDPRTNLQRRLQAMHPTQIRFGAARAAAAGVVALGALLAACEAKLPTTAEIQHMDVASAERTARANGFVGDTIVYLVNGVPVTQRQAEAIPDSVVSTVRFAPDNGRGSAQLIVTTVPRNWTLATFEPDTGAAQRAAASEMRGRVGRSGAVSQGRGPGNADGSGTSILAESHFDASKFRGLLFIDGKQVDPSALQALPRSSIESIEVIKGKAVIGQYSDPAAVNGVIRVTTKR